MTNDLESNTSTSDALSRLIVREDVLQICYWYQGEGFGERFTPDAVLPFLQSDREIVSEVFAALALEGSLVYEKGNYVFSENGRREAGRMFFESFTELQQASHGECNAGCCDGDEVCDDPSHGHGQVHSHGQGREG